MKTKNNSLFQWGSRTYVMGIINITPDSFSGDGLLTREDVIQQAIEQANKFIAAGVDILDIGGESTRPGSQFISEDEEKQRILPVIQALSKLGMPISVDTYKASVASDALQVGASWINDVWGLRADPRMAKVIAEAGAHVIIMHNRSKPAYAEIDRQLGGHYVGINYNNLIEDIQRELLDSVALAHTAGIPDEHIILDPGIGFGKTVEQNLEIINRLDEIRNIGYPVLLGASRKSFIGYTLDLPPDQRIEGTAAAVAVGIVRGVDMVRVHDVQAMVRVSRMVDAILGKRKS
jgi:dihydropteroate synthase